MLGLIFRHIVRAAADGLEPVHGFPADGFRPALVVQIGHGGEQQLVLRGNLQRAGVGVAQLALIGKQVHVRDPEEGAALRQAGEGVQQVFGRRLVAVAEHDIVAHRADQGGVVLPVPVGKDVRLDLIGGRLNIPDGIEHGVAGMGALRKLHAARDKAAQVAGNADSQLDIFVIRRGRGFRAGSGRGGCGGIGLRSVRLRGVRLRGVRLRGFRLIAASGEHADEHDRAQQQHDGFPD